MRRRIGLWLAMGSMLFVLAGCSAQGGGNTDAGSKTQTQTSSVQENSAKNAEEKDTEEKDAEEKHKEGQDTEGQSAQDQEDISPTAGGIMRTAVEGEPYTWQEITITIPSEWKDRTIIKELEDGSGFTIYQKMSYEKDDQMGYLCGFVRADRMLNLDEGERALAYTDANTIYYLWQPTDVSYFYDDEKIGKDYLDLISRIFEVAATIQVDAQGLHYNPEEYILPLSKTLAISEEDLLNRSDNELWIARNEIYARHGRQFTSEYLNHYFASCTWYEGTTAPDAFQDSVLSQVEKDNLKKIQEAEALFKEKVPYPREYQVKDTVKEDLNDDGKPEEIRYIPGEKPVIVIDGEEYSLDFYGIEMKDPEMDVFYITNLSDAYNYAGKEIAVIDNGENGDPVTYFFTYRLTFEEVGQIEGIPFKEKTGINGFMPYSSRVEGVRKLEMLNDASIYVGWWYDNSSKKLTETTGYYTMVPDGGRVLTQDMTIYAGTTEDSVTFVLPAGERVFCLWTDAEEWIQVKGKSGIRGFVHVKDGKVSPTGADLNAVMGSTGK